MPTYVVTLSIIGRALVEVEADSKDAAIEKAAEEVTLQDIDEFEAMIRPCRGNVCSRPSPWSGSAKQIDD